MSSTVWLCRLQLLRWKPAKQMPSHRAWAGDGFLLQKQQRHTTVQYMSMYWWQHVPDSTVRITGVVQKAFTTHAVWLSCPQQTAKRAHNITGFK
jgi:hypothetical protein